SAGEPVLAIGGTSMPPLLFHAWSRTRTRRRRVQGCLVRESRGSNRRQHRPGPYTVAEMAADTAARSSIMPESGRATSLVTPSDSSPRNCATHGPISYDPSCSCIGWAQHLLHTGLRPG